jgi:hypothetical protein
VSTEYDAGFELWLSGLAEMLAIASHADTAAFLGLVCNKEETQRAITGIMFCPKSIL